MSYSAGYPYHITTVVYPAVSNVPENVSQFVYSQLRKKILPTGKQLSTVSFCPTANYAKYKCRMHHPKNRDTRCALCTHRNMSLVSWMRMRSELRCGEPSLALPVYGVHISFYELSYAVQYVSYKLSPLNIKKNIIPRSPSNLEFFFCVFGLSLGLC
jgi:hypothetical protein